MDKIESILRLGPVMPVLIVDNAEDAVAIAKALRDGGLTAIEVTLRTAVALDAIKKISALGDVVVGAGTVLSEADMIGAVDAGAHFAVSPGFTPAIAACARRLKIPYMPGVSSASDIMLGMECGLRHFKFFPAVASGGIPALRALCAPFKDALFCPTGGISADTASDWLALPQVLCVGGTWLVDRHNPDPSRITATTRSTVNELTKRA